MIATMIGGVEPFVSNEKIMNMSSNLIREVISNNKQEFESSMLFTSENFISLKSENERLKMEMQTYKDELVILKGLLKSQQTAKEDGSIKDHNTISPETFDLTISTLRGGLLNDARESIEKLTEQVDQLKQENEGLKFNLKKICNSDLKRLGDDLTRSRILGEVFYVIQYHLIITNNNNKGAIECNR